MTTPVGPDRGTRVLEPVRSLQLAFLARRYYVDGKSKVEIAEETGISRFRIARLLDEAKEAGIVTISIANPTLIDTERSLAISERYGLTQALVATSADFSEASARSAAAALGAALLAETLTEDDVVGVGWGRTLFELMSHLGELAPCSAVQVVGGMPDVELWMNSVDLVRRFAAHTGGQMTTFLLPYLTSDEATAASLRRDAGFRRAVGCFSSLTVLVAAIGSWDPPKSGLFDLLTEDERSEIIKAGVVADMFGTLVDADGQIVSTGLERRCIGITPSEIANVPSVVAISSGVDKAHAIKAVLKSGLVHSLVTDLGAADLLLE
ncbi:MAG: transcriptional regulator [Actinomycetota bacterium]|nr:transcriptional regulator [Actinomycetota bacterium]